jgi:hypothetical protein
MYYDASQPDADIRSKSPAADRSAHAKRGIERLEKGRVAEWLAQALRRTLFEHSWSNGLISLSGDEHDRNHLLANPHFSEEIGSGHAWHRYVEDQTFNGNSCVLENGKFRRLCRGKCTTDGVKRSVPPQMTKPTKVSFSK